MVLCAPESLRERAISAEMMSRQRYVSEALFPCQGPVSSMPRRASGKKGVARREKRQYQQASVSNSLKRGMPCEDESVKPLLVREGGDGNVKTSYNGCP